MRGEPGNEAIDYILGGKNWCSCSFTYFQNRPGEIHTGKGDVIVLLRGRMLEEGFLHRWLKCKRVTVTVTASGEEREKGINTWLG